MESINLNPKTLQRRSRIKLLPLLMSIGETFPPLTAVFGVVNGEISVSLSMGPDTVQSVVIVGDEGHSPQPLLRTMLASLSLTNPPKVMRLALVNLGTSVRCCAQLPHLWNGRAASPQRATKLLDLVLLEIQRRHLVQRPHPALMVVIDALTECILAKVSKVLECGPSVGQSGAETIEEYLVYLEGEGLSPATLGIAYRNIRALYHWMYDRYEDEMEGKNPFKWLHHPTMPELLPKNITLNEVLILVHSIKGPERKGDPSWVPHRDRLIIKTLFYTGMRSAELLSLRVGDVDLEKRLLRVTRWKVHKEEFIPTAQSLVPEFKEWIEVHRPAVEGDGLWPTRQTGSNDGLFLAKKGLAEMLRRRCINAGLKEYRAHSFRHGCAINIIKRGGDISLVQKILGHRDIMTSQIYLRYDMDTITGLYDKVFD